MNAKVSNETLSKYDHTANLTFTLPCIYRFLLPALVFGYLYTFKMTVGFTSNVDSERRMVSMLKRVGLGSAIAEKGESDTIVKYSIKAAMKEVRQRCRACPTVDLCERWLAGHEDCDNSFCPNAGLFNELKVICSPVSRR